MKKLITLSLALAAIFFVAQCTAGYNPPAGSIYTDVKMNKDVSTKTAVSGKTGKACASGILGVIATGDASVKAAAANGKIGTVNSVDYHSKSILGSLFTETCTLVNGD